MIENQTTKLKGSRLTARQARGLSTANWNALRPVVCVCQHCTCVLVLSKGPQYLRMYPPLALVARLSPWVRAYLPFSLLSVIHFGGVARETWYLASSLMDLLNCNWLG